MGRSLDKQGYVAMGLTPAVGSPRPRARDQSEPGQMMRSVGPRGHGFGKRPRNRGADGP